MIVASCWFSLSSHFAHDARSEEPTEEVESLGRPLTKSFAVAISYIVLFL